LEVYRANYLDRLGGLRLDDGKIPKDRENGVAQFMRDSILLHDTADRNSWLLRNVIEK